MLLFPEEDYWMMIQGRNVAASLSYRIVLFQNRPLQEQLHFQLILDWQNQYLHYHKLQRFIFSYTFVLLLVC